MIQNQISLSIVEHVGSPDEEQVNHIHYLPNHAMVRHDKDTIKVRLVYDTAMVLHSMIVFMLDLNLNRVYLPCC